MGVLRCKMCGAPIETTDNNRLVTCNYCGSKQTIIDANDEKKTNLFNRANQLRMNCDFDGAIVAYESIVSLYPQEPEAYWGLALSKFGIEYVDDPKTKKKTPTIHRSSYEYFEKDSNYLRALEYSDIIAKEHYKSEAIEITNIQKSILNISKNEKPFDIFICYKEKDSDGKRTRDSVIGQELHQLLTEKGYKVFFSRVTLEHKLGTMYEPYIFAALNSAKIMIVIGTKKEYFTSTWVKNEWSRFLSLMQGKGDKYIIPCFKDMDAYEMPEELLGFQAQDLNKLGFIQDLMLGIKKLCEKDYKKSTLISHTSNINCDSLLKRAELFIQFKEYEKADAILEEILNTYPTDFKANILKSVIVNGKTSIELLKTSNKKITDMNFLIASKYADDDEKKLIDSINAQINKNLEENEKSLNYSKAIDLMNECNFKQASIIFESLYDYKDSMSLLTKCKDEINNELYIKAKTHFNNGQFDEAYLIFTSIEFYLDSAEILKNYNTLKQEKINQDKYNSAILDNNIDPVNDLEKIENSLKILETILDYKNSRELFLEYTSYYNKGIQIKMLNAEKRAKKRARNKKIFTFSSIISAFVAVILLISLLCHYYVVIPNVQQETFKQMVYEEKYEDAYEYYWTMDEKSKKDSEIWKLYHICDAGIYFKKSDYKSGIECINKAGGVTSVTYETHGGYLPVYNDVVSTTLPFRSPSCIGKTFQSWSLKKFEIDEKTFNANIILSAVYTTIVYSIKYELDGGKNSLYNIYFYTIDDYVTLYDATKEGYKFLGWFTQRSENRVLFLEKGTYGNIVLHAKRSPIKNNLEVISSDSSRGTVRITKGEGFTDEKITIEAIGINGGKFKYWLDKNKLVVSTSSTYSFVMPAKDIVLQAVFTTVVEQKNEEMDINYARKPIISESNKNAIYGLYPQTHVNDSNIINALNSLTTPSFSGWYLYKEEYYAKTIANPMSTEYLFNDGTIIERNKTYWFKCSPIEWNIIRRNNNEYFLLSSMLLDAHYFYDYLYNDSNNDESINENNYEYSHIRSFLNNEFYNSAFALGSSSVQTIKNYDYEYINLPRDDKVFLLSSNDYLSTKYGFDSNTTESVTRICATTDWARARGAYCNEQNYGYYWTRSPSSASNICVDWINDKGAVVKKDYYHYTYEQRFCVRPALTIEIQN